MTFFQADQFTWTAGGLGCCDSGAVFGFPSTTPSRLRELIALQVGDVSPAGLHQHVRLDAEHVVPPACSHSHLVVPQQVRINEDTQRRGVTKGRHATVDL